MSPTRPPADAPAADLHRLSASVDRLTAHVADWSTRRLLDEGLDLVRDAAWADACALFRVGDDEVAVLHTRPTLRPDGSALDEGDVPRPPVSAVVPTDWFPWGLAPIQADRFVLVDDARSLPASPTDGATLGSLGVRSCLHLPLRQRGRTVGAIQVFWSEPRLVWDDDRGRLLRTLGRFLLTCDGRQRR
jgi:GAF domain-containing protein